MHSHWTAISELRDQGWVAYSREMPQAVTPGETRGQALANLEVLSALLLSAGIGGADLAFPLDDDEAACEAGLAFV